MFSYQPNRPVYKSYTVKHVQVINNGTCFRQTLVNPIAFRMKDHAYSFKQMLKTVHPSEFFVVEELDDDKKMEGLNVYSFDLKKTLY